MILQKINTWDELLSAITTTGGVYYQQFFLHSFIGRRVYGEDRCCNPVILTEDGGVHYQKGNP